MIRVLLELGLIGTFGDNAFFCFFFEKERSMSSISTEARPLSGPLHVMPIFSKSFISDPPITTSWLMLLSLLMTTEEAEALSIESVVGEVFHREGETVQSPIEFDMKFPILKNEGDSNTRGKKVVHESINYLVDDRLR